MQPYKIVKEKGFAHKEREKRHGEEFGECFCLMLIFMFFFSVEKVVCPNIEIGLKITLVSSSLPGCPIHMALSHTEAKKPPKTCKLLNILWRKQ